MHKQLMLMELDKLSTRSSLHKKLDKSDEISKETLDVQKGRPHLKVHHKDLR